MSKIKSLKLVVSPGYPKSFVEITTLDGAGRDVGYRGVLEDGLQYKGAFDFIFTPDGGGPDEVTRIFGTGGSEPFYQGKPREEKPEGVTDPDPGTGPNPGYSIDTPEGFEVGSSAWIYDLSLRYALNHKKARNGAVTIKGHLEGVGSTQSWVGRVEDGKLRKA